MSVPSSRDLLHGTFLDVKFLSSPLALTLPYTAEAHHPFRHLHTVDLAGFTITLAIPTRIFDSDSFVPYMHQLAHNIRTRR